MASDNVEKYDEIRDEIKEYDSERLCDISEIEIFYGELHIDRCDEVQMQQIFERTKREWKKFGEEDPYWSVITWDEFKKENMDDNAMKRFYRSGWNEVLKIKEILSKNGIIKNVDELKKLNITEYGCGCGRVTWGLSKIFNKVIAVDISKGNLEVAREKVHSENVDFRMIADLNQYGELPSTDIAYSYLVLQHNCPPVIEYILEKMMGSLNMGGVAIFQVPTYLYGYEFNFEKYMEQKETMEMHLLPSKRVFELIYENDCIPLDVYREKCTGKDDGSTLFIVKKAR